MENFPSAPFSTLIVQQPGLHAISVSKYLHGEQTFDYRGLFSLSSKGLTWPSSWMLKPDKQVPRNNGWRAGVDSPSLALFKSGPDVGLTDLLQFKRELIEEWPVACAIQEVRPDDHSGPFPSQKSKNCHHNVAPPFQFMWCFAAKQFPGIQPMFWIGSGGGKAVSPPLGVPKSWAGWKITTLLA